MLDEDITCRDRWCIGKCDSQQGATSNKGISGIVPEEPKKSQKVRIGLNLIEEDNRVILASSHFISGDCAEPEIELIRCCRRLKYSRAGLVLDKVYLNVVGKKTFGYIPNDI